MTSFFVTGHCFKYEICLPTAPVTGSISLEAVKRSATTLPILGGTSLYPPKAKSKPKSLKHQAVKITLLGTKEDHLGAHSLKCIY